MHKLRVQVGITDTHNSFVFKLRPAPTKGKIFKHGELTDISKLPLEDPKVKKNTRFPGPSTPDLTISQQLSGARHDVSFMPVRQAENAERWGERRRRNQPRGRRLGLIRARNSALVLQGPRPCFPELSSPLTGFAISLEFDYLFTLISPSFLPLSP